MLQIWNAVKNCLHKTIIGIGMNTSQKIALKLDEK
jgi:hypothetical protein